MLAVGPRAVCSVAASEMHFQFRVIGLRFIEIVEGSGHEFWAGFQRSLVFCFWALDSFY